MNKQEYAEAAIKEVARYDAHTDYVEQRGEQLPSTKQGFEAREKAKTEGRLKTYRGANPK